MSAEGYSVAVPETRQDVLISHLELARISIHDDVALVDQKTGILIAFCGAAIGFSLDHVRETGSGHGFLPAVMGNLAPVLFWTSAFLFGVSTYIALRVVRPRVLKSGGSSLFWKSTLYDLPPAEFVKRIDSMPVTELEQDMLLDLRSIAIICRTKFDHFRHALRFAEIAFVVAVVAEVIAHLS